MTLSRVTVVERDAFEFLGKLKSESVDLVVTDPPYESLEKHRAKGTTTRLKVSNGSSNPWFTVIPNARLPELMTQLYRVLKPNSHAYVFCDETTLFLLKPAGEQAGFTFWKSLVWVKTRQHLPKVLPAGPADVAASMVHMGMGYHWRNSTERVAFFTKGTKSNSECKRKLNDLGAPDVLFGARSEGEYPTQKPLAVVAALVANSSQPGELVLDPFCGSGTTGLAARDLGRRALLVDINAAAARARLGAR